MQIFNQVELFKNLADETRLSIVKQLNQSDCEVAGRDIIPKCSDELQLSQPTMSHHFCKLVRAGILLENKVGTEKFYRLNRPLLTACGINLEAL
jgi:DNA-binding transcriptional ArsR family regulator